MRNLVKIMKMNDKQIQKLISFVLKEMKQGQVVQFKDSEEAIINKSLELIKTEMQKISDLDKEVHKMMDDLERQNPGSFERYKMFPLLKKRLAKEKGIIL